MANKKEKAHLFSSFFLFGLNPLLYPKIAALDCWNILLVPPKLKIKSEFFSCQHASAAQRGSGSIHPPCNLSDSAHTAGGIS